MAPFTRSVLPEQNEYAGVNDSETITLPPQSVWRRSAPMATIAGWTDGFPLTPIQAHLEAAARAHPGHRRLGLREQFDFAELMQRVHRIGAWVQRTVPRDQAVATLLAHTPAGIAAILGCVAAQDGA